MWWWYISTYSRKGIDDSILARKSTTKMSEKDKSSFENEHGLVAMPSTKPSNEDIFLDAVRNNWWARKKTPQDMKSNKKIALAAVEQNGEALEYVSEDMKGDKDVVLAAVKQDGEALQYANENMKGYKEVVLAAVEQHGRALKYASDDMKRDKDIVLAAVKQDGYALAFASKDIFGDKIFVLAAVEQYGYALKFASDDMKRDKDLVLAAVKQDGYALLFANKDMKGDKDIVLAAVMNRGAALECANKNMGGDKDIVLAAVKQNGLALKFASNNLQADKEVVFAAVQNDPDALKFAKDGLNQDDESWIAAGLWNEKLSAALVCSSSIKQQPKLFVLSTRFSLQEDSESQVTRFTKLLNRTTFVQKNNIVLYSPNKFSKCSCDERWTRMDWPCRGTVKSCIMTNLSKEGKPHDGCCWRFSFRWHLETAKKSKGVMIQVVDCVYIMNKNKSYYEHILGDGQKIENVMAKRVGTKIFRVYQPCKKLRHIHLLPRPFEVDHITTLLSKIQCWYDDGCKDMTDCEIFFNEEL